jgi:glycerol uptake facilitator protein
MNSSPSLFQKSIAETVGTFLLVFLGCGAVHAAVLMGAQSGIWQVAVVWGIAIALAIYTVDAISGAHINPAMTLAFAVWGRHPWRHVLPYFAAQFLGAFSAAAILFCLFSGFISAKETEKGVRRGDPGSVVTAMCYGEYFPNPGSLATSPDRYNAVAHAELKKRLSHSAAFVTELLGTMILACIVFSLTDSKNSHRPQSNLAPIFIGLTVSVLISVVAPLTQAGFNPARDFGPRVFAYLAGWGAVAIPGLSEPGWLTVYIVAPFLGAVLGGGFYQTVLRTSYPDVEGNH